MYAKWYLHPRWRATWDRPEGRRHWILRTTDSHCERPLRARISLPWRGRICLPESRRKGAGEREAGVQERNRTPPQVLGVWTIHWRVPTFIQLPNSRRSGQSQGQFEERYSLDYGAKGWSHSKQKNHYRLKSTFQPAPRISIDCKQLLTRFCKGRGFYFDNVPFAALSDPELCIHAFRLTMSIKMYLRGWKR